MFNHRLTRTVAVALALGAVAAPVAAAEPADWSPPKEFQTAGARDAADKRYTGRGIYEPIPAQEPKQSLVHPDTRDYAEGRGTYNSPEVMVVKVPAPADAVATGGVDWADVGIGAGGLLAVALLGTGGVLVVVRRRSVQLAG